MFLRGGLQELRAKQPGMMTLISLAIIVAFGYSAAVTLGLDGMDFWWELATLITIMLLGHWIEMSAIMGAQNALGELAKLLPDEAELLHGDHTMTVPVSELVVGDLVLVKPGRERPGRRRRGRRRVRGERGVAHRGVVPGARNPRATTSSAGSINGSGALTRAGHEGRRRDRARRHHAPGRRRAGQQVRCADPRRPGGGLLFYVAIGAAALTLVAWWLLQPDDPGFVLERVVTVLIIACPHALGLAIPLVAQISTALGARHGLLVRSRLALEGGPPGRRRALRQDRHPHPGQPRRRRTSWPPKEDSDERARARGGGGGQLRASAGPAIVAEAAARGSTVTARPRSRRSPAAASRRPWRPHGTRSPASALSPSAA